MKDSNIKYHLEARGFIYDNRQLWFEEPNTLIKIYEDRKTAEEMLAKCNITGYVDKYIYQFIDTMPNREAILEKLENFLRIEFDVSMKAPHHSFYEINFRLPAMSIEQYQKVHDIIGITWCVLKEVEPTGLFIIRYCFGYEYHPEDLFWVVQNKFATYEEAEDAAICCILFAIAYHANDIGSLYEFVGTLEKLSRTEDSLKDFLSKSEYFYFKEYGYYSKGKGAIFMKKAPKKIRKKIKVDFGSGLKDWIVDDFESSLKEECRNLKKAIKGIYHDIVQV